MDPTVTVGFKPGNLDSKESRDLALPNLLKALARLADKGAELLEVVIDRQKIGLEMDQMTVHRARREKN